LYGKDKEKRLGLSLRKLQAIVGGWMIEGWRVDAKRHGTPHIVTLGNPEEFEKTTNHFVSIYSERILRVSPREAGGY
jgi:hypothetical protein